MNAPKNLVQWLLSRRRKGRTPVNATLGAGVRPIIPLRGRLYNPLLALQLEASLLEVEIAQEVENGDKATAMMLRCQRIASLANLVRSPIKAHHIDIGA